MILLRCAALLGLLGGSSCSLLATATAAESDGGLFIAEDNKPKEEQQGRVVEDDAAAVPSWLQPKSNLRKMPTTKEFMETHASGALAVEMPKLDKLTAMEQMDLIKTFKHQMIALADDLGDLDVSGATEDLQALTLAGKEYTYKAVNVVEEALIFINKTLHLGADSPSAIISTSSSGDKEDHFVVDHEEEEVSRRLMNDHDGNEEQHSNKEYKDFRKQHKEYQKKYKKKFEQSYPQHFGSSFQYHATKHHAERADTMRDAILSGNFEAAFTAFHSTGSNHQRMSSREHRRMSAAHGRRLSKHEQCKLLANCAGAMTMFDLFVYFYSDDIDPSKGEVDDNLLKFDEADIVGQWNKIKNLIKTAQSNGYQQDFCDNLLKMFHRTIENGNAPEWEGASVNQVCLAEGTTVFVKYMEMVKALVDQSFPDGYNSVSEKKWKEDTDKSVKMVAEKIAVEPFRCAENLFYHGDRKDPQEFPFGGCGGQNTDSCAITKYKFPVKFDVSTVETKAKTYEKRKYTVKCPSGYGIKTKAQCSEAGMAVGGKLISGKVSVGNGNTPCGCSLSASGRNDDGAIYWRAGSSNCQNKNWHFIQVCEEHNSDYEIVSFKTKCDPGYELTLDECEEAGVAVGGYLFDNWKVRVNDWGHTPCGCFLERNGANMEKIYFDKGRRCSNSNWNYQSVCKRKKTTYKSLPAPRPRCDPGFEIKDKGECQRAGKAVGGHSFKEVSLSHTPNYCFIYGKSGVIHYNRNARSKANKNNDFDVVCKLNPEAENYKKVPFQKKCPEGTEITRVEECEAAGQYLGGFLPDNYNVAQGDWSHTPCGCSIDHKSKIIFDRGSTGCAVSAYHEVVCHQSQAQGDKVAGRDVHGKLLSNDHPGFISMNYDGVKRAADACIKEELDGMEKDCLDESGNSKNSKFYGCLVDKRETAIEACDRFGPIQTALELVFGMETSPGFICGITDAIVNDGVAMPGSCCLDAPYELDGDDWGHPFDCETNKRCKNPGPYLAGVSSEACDASGGTWCPSKADCTVLKNCVQSMTDVAKKEKLPAFEKYLEAAPQIKNPNDRNHCGRAREYFGFDEFFVNDQQICDDIEQLKHTRDFDFLNEFFNQGSGSGGSDNGVHALVLNPPDRTRSDAEENKQHWSWKATNYALEVSAFALSYVKDNVIDMDCMCDPTCASENICKSVKMVAGQHLSTILMALEKIVAAAQNLFESLSAPEEGVRAEENTEVLYDNMQLMADYLVEMRKEINNRRNLMALPGGEGSIVDVDDDGGTAKQCNAAFEVKLQVLQKTTTRAIFAISTLGGDLVPAEFKFSKLGKEDREISVDYNKTSLEPGKAIVRFGTDVDGEDFLIMQAHQADGSGVANELLSFV